jgi:hypothetical protein
MGNKVLQFLGDLGGDLRKVFISNGHYGCIGIYGRHFNMAFLFFSV